MVRRILCVQAQDLGGARLAIRARTRGLTASDVDGAFSDRSLVVAYLNRGTLHLTCAEDYPWLQALLAPPLLAGSLRRLAQEGVAPDDADRGVAVMERALADDGPLTRPQLGERVASAGVRTQGQALVHVLRLGCLRGIAVRSGAQYVLVRDWLGEPPRVDRDAALRELGRRYLAGHAPGDDRDLARWTGLPLRDTRAALAAAGAGPRYAAEIPPARLLGPFDPVLFGWASRDWILGDLAPRITVGGMFKAFALRHGRAAGTWHDVAGDRDLDEERTDLARFLGQTT